jgi:alkanesulfonate monooxygenase SsuD/methylene tetrahydromethanopterin reductase-like flavin-dependent oxidoreductase (luciferase family)
MGALTRPIARAQSPATAERTVTSSTPFALGSISLRLYPHNELGAGGILRELCDQAQLGLSGGFDGIMTSEHHGGFPGYLPNPLQIASFILEETASGWVAPCPLLLPLRPVAQLAEEVAWLGARHPGRVGLGVAAGALPLDFAAMEVALADAVPLFKTRLPRIVEMLQGRDLRELEGDPALHECATSPIAVLSAAASTATRAALCGAGILTEGMSSAPQLREICDAYIAAGGTQPRVTIRRVWLGQPRSELIGRQRAVYDSYAGDAHHFADDQTITARQPDELAERLCDTWRATGADAINLRVHLPGLSPHEVRQQITILGEQVLPLLRTRWTPGDTAERVTGPGH